MRYPFHGDPRSKEQGRRLSAKSHNENPFLFCGPSFPSWGTVAHENLGNDSSKEPLYVRWLYTAAALPVKK